MQNKKVIISLLICLQSLVSYCQSDFDSSLIHPKRIDPRFDTICINCDTTVNFKLILNKRNSIINNLDKNFEKNKYKSTIGLKTSFPSLFYRSINRIEYLKIVNFDGGNESGCSYFEVGYCSNKPKIKYAGISNEKKFITESGVKLGMSRQDFFYLKGEQYKLFSCEDGIDTYYYRYGLALYQTHITIDDPIYIGVYKFKNDKLIQFGFGYLPVIPD